MRKEIQDLRTNARIFQLSKCTTCTFTLDLPAVHFMCMHSFHQRCLGDNEKECPECAPEYRSVLEMKRSLEQNSKNQDLFFNQVKSSKDGFSVIAEYFGKGIISKTKKGPAGSVWSTNTSTTDFWAFNGLHSICLDLFETGRVVKRLSIEGRSVHEGRSNSFREVINCFICTSADSEELFVTFEKFWWCFHNELYEVIFHMFVSHL